jgi:hypothetical protein
MILLRASILITSYSKQAFQESNQTMCIAETFKIGLLERQVSLGKIILVKLEELCGQKSFGSTSVRKVKHQEQCRINLNISMPVEAQETMHMSGKLWNFPEKTASRQ